VRLDEATAEMERPPGADGVAGRWLRVGRAPRLSTMRDSAIRLADQAQALQSVAEQIRDGFQNRECAPVVPDVLVRVEEALRTLDRALHDVADTFMPPVEMHQLLTTRFALAASDWPGSIDGVGPSYEGQIELLAALHDAAATLHHAAAGCGRAAHLLATSCS
jgi:hypothetical protein